MKLTDSIQAVLRGKGEAVWSVGPGQSAYEAVQVMMERQVGALLVMTDGELVGMVSERDCARRIVLEDRPARQTPVAEIMSSPVVVVEPRQTVDEAMAIMTGRRIRHLPVVDGGRLVGMVSIGDLVKWTITQQSETIDHLGAYIAGGQVAAKL